MSGSIMTILFVLPVVLLSMLLPLALVVALQVWLCRKGKWLGLILPAITLAMSLMICLSVVGFSAVTGGGSVQVTDGHGNIVEEYHREEEHHQLQPADLAMVGGVFLVFNVPTLVLGGIWLLLYTHPVLGSNIHNGVFGRNSFYEVSKGLACHIHLDGVFRFI